MEIIRRLQGEDDLTDLFNLSREFFAEYEAHHEEFFDIDDLQDGHITGYFARTINSDDNATFVAVVDQQIVGYITVHVRPQAEFWKVKKAGTISGLMVQRGHRRSGIATRLLARAQAFFEAHSVRYFTVYTAVTNEGALRFYKSNDMVPLHTMLLGEIS